jgi:hypothetical protein
MFLDLLNSAEAIQLFPTPGDNGTIVATGKTGVVIAVLLHHEYRKQQLKCYLMPNATKYTMQCNTMQYNNNAKQRLITT